MQIQNPVIDPSRFDLVVVPRHDHLAGPNVMTTRGALHRVTAEKLHGEAAKFLPQLAHLPSPRVAVLIGGANAVYSLAPREMKVIAAQLAALAGQGMGIMVTPSRRTGEENLAILRQALRGTSAYMWTGRAITPITACWGWPTR